MKLMMPTTRPSSSTRTTSFDVGLNWRYRGRWGPPPVFTVRSRDARSPGGETLRQLLRHPAVRLAAVIGLPDPVRTESIKAFLVLAEGQRSSEALEHEIREFVKTRLARHE